MKILYVNPSRIASGLDAVIKGPPLNLISLAAMVPEHDAKLTDFKVEKFQEKKFRSDLNHHDVVAITSMTPQIDSALEVARIAKDQGCKTIVGGYHPTLDPNYVAKDLGVDYAVRGEGENTFRELIDFIDGNKYNIQEKDIDGISYMKNGEIIHNKDRALECNLDNFPIPRHDLIRRKNYLYLGTRLDQMESSRGCPHNCTFCCIKKMWSDPNNKRMAYRTKSIKRIMQEIYSVDWKFNFLFFCEDNFTINVKRTKKILDTIIHSGVNSELYFSCQSRVDTLYRNPWLIDLMEKAGFRQIFLGIETVHQQSLDAMNKQNTTPKMTQKVVEMVKDRGISIFGGVIIGYPGETREMVHQTIQFVKSLKLTCVQFTPITAFPGTPFFEEMKEKGRITSYNYKHYNLFHPMMGTDRLTNIEMYRLVAEAYASYYLGSDYIKDVAKRYCNPFSKWRWMGSSVPRYGKTVIGEAYGMFMTQGITRRAISEDLQDLRRRADEAGTFNYLITKTPHYDPEKIREKVKALNKKKKKKDYKEKREKKTIPQKKEIDVLVG
ncbi:MAG: B12-binding domain-containing radical SAM protein [Promethearchaeota archaeon]